MTLLSGMVSATFRERNSDEIILLCKENQLCAVEWSENVHVLPDDKEGARQLYKKTNDAGLEVAAYGSYYRLGSNKDIEKVFSDSLISAYNLKAPTIRIWAGTKPSCEVDDFELESLAKEADKVSQMAAEYGIKIALEWHKNTLTDTNESAKRLLQLTDNNNLYCLWQPTVALSENSRCEGIKMLNDRLLNFHVYYWLEGKRRPLAEGESYWKKYFSCVKTDAPRYALLEFVMNNSEEQFVNDAKTLTKWINTIEG